MSALRQPRISTEGSATDSWWPGIITEIGGQIGWLATGMDFRFIKPVYFKDTITCRFTITSIDEMGKAVAEATYTNQNGMVVLEASITGILPNARERDILSQMVAEGDPTNKRKSS